MAAVTLVLQRFDPDVDDRPHWAEYSVTVEPGDHLLDLLHRLKEDDGTLTFRRSCGHGVCGSDAVLVNGRNRLACTTRVDELDHPIVVEPIRGLPVIKDLVVDTEPFFEQYRSVRPWLVRGEADGGGREQHQTPDELERIRASASCILCAACTTACPISWTNDRYVGPAALVAAHRFVFDSRDDAAEHRLALVDEGAGVWGCRTAFECTDACPRDIPVTESIQELKREALRRRL